MCAGAIVVVVVTIRQRRSCDGHDLGGEREGNRGSRRVEAGGWMHDHPPADFGSVFGFVW